MNLGLNGKVALVTGSSSGIGRAIALCLAEEGANIVVTGRDPAKAEAVAAEVRARGVTVLAVPADLTAAADIKRLVATTVEQLGGVDILVNNAGTGRLSDLLAFPDDEFKDNLELMLFGALRTAREVIPQMKQAGWGRIVNISSIFGKQPGGLVDYDSIKAAMIMLTKDLAGYLAKDNILVNAGLPRSGADSPLGEPRWPGGAARTDAG